LQRLVVSGVSIGVGAVVVDGDGGDVVVFDLIPGSSQPSV
jgi:hypothetical protein